MARYYGVWIMFKTIVVVCLNYFLVLVPSKPQVRIPLKTILLLGQLGILKRQLPNHLSKTRVLLRQVANDTGCSG